MVQVPGAQQVIDFEAGRSRRIGPHWRREIAYTDGQRG
jgi:hypothetical protein